MLSLNYHLLNYLNPQTFQTLLLNQYYIKLNNSKTTGLNFKVETYKFLKKIICLTTMYKKKKLNL